MCDVTYVSDLHLEFFKDIPESYKPWKPKKDILCLCGDIGNPLKNTYKEYIKYCSLIFNYVFVIAGNHEYYTNKTIEEINLIIESVCSQYKNVYFLNNKIHYIDEYNTCILGSTLWTQPPSNYVFGYNDFKCIPEMSFNKLKYLHKQSLTFIEQALATIPSEWKVIVLTHHMPTLDLIATKYINDPLNGLFATNLNYIFDKYKINYWICGHSHTSNDIIIKNTRVLLNPIGYKNENSLIHWDASFKI